MEDHDELTRSEQIQSSLLAGAFAGALAKTAIAPLDRTKIYFQTTPSAHFTFSSVVNYLKQTLSKTGFFSLYRGNSATMARIIPYSAIQFTAHEQYKQLLVPMALNSPNSARFLSGSLAGVTAQSITYPLDMTRARLAVSHEYTSLFDVFKKVYKFEGIRTFYKGYVATMIGVIPYAGFSFYSYETLKSLYVDKFGEESSGLVRVAFGAVGGVVGQSSSYPFDIVRRRKQVGVVVEKWGRFGVFGELWGIGRTEGLIKGLYKGLSMNWIKGPIAAGISFSVFDKSQEFLRSFRQ